MHPRSTQPARVPSTRQHGIRHARIVGAVAALLTQVAPLAHAENYTLWINGRNGSGQVGNHGDFSFWGPASAAAGVNKRAVNWDGYGRISTTNGVIRDALDCYCTGGNWCYIAAHSAGDNQIGYALSLFGASKRPVKKLDGSGVCTNTRDTQTGWNIKWVAVASGSAGGSELANIGAWAVADPLTADLKTTTARAMYDHNQTHATWFYMYAGARGTAYSFALPGQDDEVVAYHSSGAVSGSGGAAYCNPRDWLCNDLTLNTALTEGGRPKWSFHSVQFRDDAEAYDHYTRGNWQGVVGRMLIDMVRYAW